MQDIGNSKVQITEERVSSLRAGGDASPLMLIARVGMAAACIIVVLGLFWLRIRRKVKRYAT